MMKILFLEYVICLETNILFVVILIKETEFGSFKKMMFISIYFKYLTCFVICLCIFFYFSTLTSQYYYEVKRNYILKQQFAVSTEMLFGYV